LLSKHSTMSNLRGHELNNCGVDQNTSYNE
jgi:hypothetical protein